MNTAFPSGYVVEAIGSANDTATFLGSGLLTNAAGLNQTLTYPTATNLSGSAAGLSTSSTLLTENTIQFQGGANNWFGRPGARAGLAGLLITDKPIIVKQPSGPADNSVSLGESLTLTVQALGVPTLAYQWRKNGTNISGANSSSYAQGTTTLNDSGNYDVVVTNVMGSVTSSVVTINIATGTRLRIMSMNAAGGQGGFSSDAASLAQRVAAVQAAGADVVGLQEVDGDDIVAMAKALGWTNSLGAANSVTGERTDYVNPNGDTLAGRVGIISRYPVLNRIGQTTNNYGAVGATLQVSTNVRVHVFNTHLWWGAASTNAYPQGTNPVTGTYGPYWQTHGSNWVSILNMENGLLMPAVNELLDLAKPYLSNSEPVFLTGDFNLPSHKDYPSTNPWPATVACENAGLVDSYRWMHPTNRIATAGQFLATDPGITWTSLGKTSSEPGSMNGSAGTPAFDRIDFVFYSTNDNVNVTYSDTVDDSSLYSWQDHKFVLTTVFLSPVTNTVSKAINPFPATGATNVTLRPLLTWTAGTNATARNVYFGTSSPGTLQTNTIATSFSPGLLVSNTTYFWRIDEIAGGVTNTGDVWQFTTGKGPFIKANKTVYAGTDTITVGFTNGPGNAKDWIALYRQTDGYGNGGYVDYFYVDGTKSGTTAKTNGTVTFSAIGGAGTNGYVVRFFKKDLYYVLDEAGFTVTNPPFVPFSPATLPSSYIEQESLVSGSQTILNFNDLPTGQTQNAAIASGFGNNAVASSAGVTVIGAGTPDITLTFAGDANGSHWDYYIDTTWRAAQLDPNGLIANVAWNLTFTPAATNAAKINGFTFHPYPTANLWRLTFRIEVLDAVSSSVLFSTTNSFFEDGSKNGHWQNINYSGATGQALKLRITRIASTTLGSGEVEEPGASANYAVDDISFSEIFSPGSAGTYKNYINSLGPLAYYQLDDKPVDTAVCNFGSHGSAGNGVHSPGVTHPVAGAIVGDTNTACQYGPGSGDAAGISDGRFTRIPYSASLNPASSFTVELRAKATTNTDNNTGPCPISNAHLTGNRGGWDIFQRTNSTGWNLQTFTGSGSTIGANITGGTATNGQWYHLAFICSAIGTGVNAGKVTNAFYVNGVLVGGSAYAAYNTNNIDPMFFGIENYKLENTFKGAVDEVAVYNKILTGAQLLSHYQSGTNANRATPYAQTVTNDGGVNLVAYWRLGENGMTATNSGTLGSAANGTYVGATYGSPGGPPSSELPGFSAGNGCAYLNGAGNYISLANPAGLNFTNQITLQAWVRPNAVQGTAANLISHGLNTNGTAEVALRITNNTYQIQAWNGTAHGVSAAIPAGDLGTSNWVQLAGTYDGAKWNLYRNGTLLASAADSIGAVLITNENWAIGARGAGTSQFYSGFVDEVAIFNRALTSNEIATAYSGANPTNPPTIVTQPAGLVTNVGGTFSLSVVAGGSPLLAYQWTRNQTNLVGATNATYLRTNAAVADSGFYSVVVTNASGSAESIAVAVSVVYPLSAGAAVYTRAKGLSLKIRIADLLTNVTGSACTPIVLAGAGPSTNGTVITTDSTFIF
ncbi:MAG TPA: LamG-like jellyroll fold domain-containing protein, partial [Desulfuromonadaceae bacterium]|nr:LamG-like jellyroll fold domain-containing protein [Desulfuromonadaceae bacterium]